ncbi:MAG TPA: hypothetical protein PKW21_02415, partial [Rhabdaerophilum sp.]|nr:hypothetical protein [Rhabdaerophilum sp.]
MTTLVVSDYPLERVLPNLDFLGEKESATIITASMGSVPPVDTPQRRFVMPSVFVWHSNKGREQHRALEAFAGEIARHLCRHHREFANVACAAKFHILDSYLYKWLVLDNLAEVLAGQVFDRIVVVTGDERFYFLVGAAARHLGATCKVQPAWTTIPVLLRNPLVALWPERASAQILRGWHLAQRALDAFRARPALPAFERRSPTIPPNPAIIGWNLRDRNYVKGLERLLDSTLARRPVVLIVDSDTDENVAALREAVVDRIRTSGHPLEIIRLSTLHARVREEGQGASLAIAEIIADKANAFASESDLARLMRRHDIAVNLPENIHFRVIVEVAALVRSIMATTRPAYAILASGRASVFAAIAEILATENIPSMDAHIYLVGNHARQIAPPCSHFGVIDDQQEALICKTWNAAPERILRIGYFWRVTGDGQPETALPPPPEPARAPTVLICTQPGDPEMVRSFIADVLDCLVEMEDVTAIIKPHPVEQGS